MPKFYCNKISEALWEPNKPVCLLDLFEDHFENQISRQGLPSSVYCRLFTKVGKNKIV